MESKRQNNEYISRINKVIDFIENNLSEELNLEKIARISCFSPFHFHRIFSSVMNETLNKFIQRVRIEKAAWILRDNPRTTVADVCYTYGFSSPSVFSRCFRERFGISATEWRELSEKEISKICKQISKNDKHSINQSSYFANVFVVDFFNNKWSVKMENSQFGTEVSVKEFSDKHVAYVRHIGPYQGDGNLFEGLFKKLFKWAGPRGLINENAEVMSVYHDNPDITDHSKLRLSICITVPSDTKTDSDIGLMEIPGGKYAVGRFELGEKDYENAWKMMYGGWLPESGYQPEDKPAYEIYHNDPNSHPEGKHIVDICIPVKPL